MRISSTASRLKEIMSERNLSQTDIVNAAKPFCEKYGVKLGKSDLSQYVNGKTEPSRNKLTVLSLALAVSEAWLMGYNVPKEGHPAGQEGVTASTTSDPALSADAASHAIKQNQENPLPSLRKQLSEIISRELLTPGESANYLGISKNAFSYLAARGRIAPIKNADIGNHLFLRSDLDHYLAHKLRRHIPAFPLSINPLILYCLENDILSNLETADFLLQYSLLKEPYRTAAHDAICAIIQAFQTQQHSSDSSVPEHSASPIHHDKDLI